MADYRCDIMDFDYEAFEPGTFHVIWASPPCTEYSRAKTIGTRNIAFANVIVNQTFKIIKYLQPKYWFIENPQTGLLKDQVMMREVPFKDVDYCKYGMPYRKRTRIWTNFEKWAPRELCCKDCGMMEGNRHIKTAQRGPSSGNTSNRNKQEELYRIPEQLCLEIFSNILKDYVTVM